MTKKKYEIFAQNLKEHYERWKKMTPRGNQELFASLVEVENRETISKWLNGKVYPVPENMRKIEKVLGVTEEQLWSGHFHEFRYEEDSQFTHEMHDQFRAYTEAIGLSGDFLKFVKSSIPDEKFPVYSPIIAEHGMLESTLTRQPFANAFMTKSTNEFQRTASGKTVNLSYPDFQFLRSVQDEVVSLIEFLYLKRAQEMKTEVQKAQLASIKKEGDITVFCDVDLRQFDSYMKYMTKENVEEVLKNG